MAPRVFAHPYLGIYTKCYLWQTEQYNVWIDTGLRPNWTDMQEYLTDGRKNVLLMTHGHWDHIGGVELIRQHGGTVYAHPGDRRHLTDLEWHWELLFGQFAKDFDLPPARKTTFWDSVETSDLDIPVKDGDVLRFDELQFRVIETPGHSGGSVCYLEESTGTLLTGDSVMGDGFFTGTPQIENYPAYIASMERLKAFEVKQVLTDHTDPLDGTELIPLLEKSQACAKRMLEAVHAYVQTSADISVGGVAKAIAAAEGKNVGGGTCVSALGALAEETLVSQAQECAKKYIFGA
jgi:glyoxylase-like metal-dependent hydrolase (beta-lactamase superfamily II)